MDEAPITWVEGSLVGPSTEHLRYAGDAHATAERMFFWGIVEGVIMSFPDTGTEEDDLPMEYTQAATNALLANGNN